jgi:hypothetical protein
MTRKEQHYTVKWAIDIVSESAEGAARQALKIQRMAIAPFFHVFDEDGTETIIDVTALDEGGAT